MVKYFFFGICARPRPSMWLLGLLSDWSTDGLSGLGWGYKLSDHSLMTWHVELRALTQWTYERRDKSWELKVSVDVPLWVGNIIWFKKKYLTFTVNIYSENIILFKKKYLPLPEIIYSENIILPSLLFVIGDNKRNGAILACLSNQSRVESIQVWITSFISSEEIDLEWTLAKSIVYF